jgi:hypothetical protein
MSSVINTLNALVLADNANITRVNLLNVGKAPSVINTKDAIIISFTPLYATIAIVVRPLLNIPFIYKD